MYIKVAQLEDGELQKTDPVVSTIAKRQYLDWREFRHWDVNSKEVREAIERFCANICDALHRPWLSPEEAAARKRAEAERQRQEAEAKRQADEALEKTAALARERADEERRNREAAEQQRRVDEQQRRAEEQSLRDEAQAKPRAEVRALQLQHPEARAGHPRPHLALVLVGCVVAIAALGTISGWVMLGPSSPIPPPAATVGGLAAAQTIRVGIINSLTGPLALSGNEMWKGISLYAKTHEKDLPSGVKIKSLTHDDEGSADKSKSMVQKMLVNDRVQVLVGAITSPAAVASAPLATQFKIPFIITGALAPDLPSRSPYIVRVSFTPGQTIYPLGKWAAQKGWRKGYTAVSDGAAGPQAETAFGKAFTSAGGRLVGSLRFPLGNPDFVPFVQRIKEAAPDVVFIYVANSNQATAMVRAIKDLGLREKGVSVVGSGELVPDDVLSSIGDAAVGLITAGVYSTAGMRPANKAFLDAWKREYGDQVIPNYLSVGGWDGMAATYDTIKRTNGTFDTDQAMATLRGWKHDSPRGPIMIDPQTRDIVQNVYIRRTEMKDGKLTNVEFDTITDVKPPVE